ncbi:MAG TPA: AlpA family phage regulatory protein [Roseateles sp.]
MDTIESFQLRTRLNVTSAINLPATGFVRQAQLVPHIVPFSAATLWRMVRAGTFPQPVKLSARCTAWRCEEVRAWIQDRGE